MPANRKIHNIFQLLLHKGLQFQSGGVQDNYPSRICKLDNDRSLSF